MLVTKDCWIIVERGQAVRVRLNKELALDYINEKTGGRINPQEWQIIQTKIDVPSQQRAVAGQIDVNMNTIGY